MPLWSTARLVAQVSEWFFFFFFHFRSLKSPAGHLGNQRTRARPNVCPSSLVFFFFYLFICSFLPSTALVVEGLRVVRLRGTDRRREKKKRVPLDTRHFDLASLTNPYRYNPSSFVFFFSPYSLFWYFFSFFFNIVKHLRNVCVDICNAAVRWIENVMKDNIYIFFLLVSVN